MSAHASAPRPAATERRGRAAEGLSLQTLVIAALASAAAAIVTSTFWRGGTIVTAAMTPVIVAIVKEILARPMQSDLVRRPAARVRSITTTVPRVEAPPGRPRPRPQVVETAPLRRYGRRRPRLKVALITGAVAFVIAIVALTVPELIFGGSVASHGSTTLFGGGGSHQPAKSRSSTGGARSTTAPQTTTAPRSQTQPTTTSPPAAKQQPQTTTSSQPPPKSSTTSSSPTPPVPVPHP